MYHILSVDDHPGNQKLISRALASEYKVQIVSDGQEALQAVEVGKPDLILLDVYMPGMDGLETCRRLREISGPEELPVIFISALTTLNDKLNGYEAGGNDYLPKPFQIPELISKINVLLQQTKKFSEIKASRQSAVMAAMSSASNSAGDLQVIRQFIDQSLICKTVDDLAKAVFKTCTNLGLSSSLQFRFNDEELNFVSHGLITSVEAEILLTPLESELLSQARHSEKIINYGNKSLFNSNSVTILIKNMPFRDADLCRKIQDHLSIILRVCEAQLELINYRTKTNGSRNQEAIVLLRK